MPDPPSVEYSIVPWVRRGMASLITGQPATNYASLPVSITVNGSPVSVPPVRLLGPGDITGLDPRAIVRTEPRDLANAFEPNYLAAIELTPPDLPWMFTPAGVVNQRLQPWICLIVVPDAPGATIESRSGGLNVLRLDAPLNPKDELPDLTIINSWAHAQVTGQALSGQALNEALDGDPASTVSRLICPRQLQPNLSYIACVVPTYQAGVNAALGLPVDEALAPAWNASLEAPFVLPVYYQFRFHTGPGGDFASLVRKIQPPQSKVDAGTRAVDVSQPGFGAAPLPAFTLGVEGALRTIGNQSTAWPSGMQAAYESELGKALQPPPAPDPVVAPPTYGSTQSGSRLPAANTPPLWLGELNLDPRTRAAASAGTQVVQQDQEALIRVTWEQLGSIRKANQLLKYAQFARQVSDSLSARHLQTVVADGVFLQVTSPMHSRVTVQLNGIKATMRGHLESSRIPSGSTSAAMRKLTRPRGLVGRQLAAGLPKMIERLNTPANSGTPALQIAGPLQPPHGMVAFDAVSPDVQVSKMSLSLLKSAPGWKLTSVWANEEIRDRAPDDAIRATETLKLLPIDWTHNPNLPGILKGTNQNVPPVFVLPSDETTLSAFTEQFRAAASSVVNQLNQAPTPTPDQPPLGGAASLDNTRASLQAQLNPENTVKARIGARISLGSGADPLQPIRTSPQFPQAMYAPLADLSPEWMLPGISNIEADTAVLLSPNPKFIESYMIGLNEELSKELLWRQVPADRRATFFQYFWGASTADIPPIGSFTPSGHLGDHVAIQGSGKEFVLLVRATLFQRYPNAVVSAVKAQWSGNVRTLTDQRVYPAFRGDMGADVTFFGFVIDDDVFGSGDPNAKKPGWYFVFEEHVTEPRFGLEPLPAETQTGVWNDLSWKEVSLSGSFLNPASAPTSPTREGVTWGQGAASMAFILLRRPVRVAMHALALIGPQSGTQGHA